MFKILKKIISSSDSNADTQTTNIVLKVNGMKCEHCSNAVKKALSNLSDVKKVQIDLEQKTVSLSTTSTDNINQIADVINNLGFEVVDIQK